GITVASAPSYLALPNVGCIGGSWLTASLDPATIEELAAEAAAL
ncbi:MAG TPA: keto-deoxy-phosphogluconate aldolase, partial [Amycolatopsis sp.]|nr:keto-deoxy-phosphogluconate aldolase [Amycolatopsis sp.]